MAIVWTAIVSCRLPATVAKAARKMKRFFLILSCILLAARGQEMTEEEEALEDMKDDKCVKTPRPYTMPDLESGQCDAYVFCERGETIRKLCDDGYVYHVIDHNCDLPHRVKCTGRERLQPPKGSGNCPRLNGLYASTEYCDQYYYCRAGIPLLITCAAGLVYDTKAGVCEFPDVALRPGCMPEEVLGFTCPRVANSTELAFGDHTRHPKTDDCRYFYKCLKNGHPRLGGCEVGLVFNRDTGSCDVPKNVKGCENYYDREDDE